VTVEVLAGPVVAHRGARAGVTGGDLDIAQATPASSVVVTKVYGGACADVPCQALRGVTGERPLIAAKGGHWRDGDSFPVDGRPDTLRAHCEISLRTLGVDQIGLYQLHHVDPAVPLLDSAGALEQLRQEGKIAALGLSNVTVAQLDEALTVAPNRFGSEPVLDSAALLDLTELDLTDKDLADLRIG
jgi:hypothetical protein